MTVEIWREQRGAKPYRVTVYERPDKGMTVWLRWWEDGRARLKMTEVRTIRDARGRALKRSVEAAQAEADRKIAELSGEIVPARKPAGPLTLREGVRLAFTERGPYPLDPAKHRHTRETKERTEDFIAALGGEDVRWEDITPGMVRAIWRKIAKQYPDGGGYAKAEKIIVALYRISGWLQGEYPDQRFPAPLKGWRKEIAEHWAHVGHKIVKHQPSHTETEVHALFAHLGKADPRLALALMLGAELRGGQVIRTMRSDLDLGEEAGIGSGVAQIPFVSNRKRAPRIVLNQGERAAIDAAMTTGYLRELEAAYRAGEIEDYPLFPGGKLRGGVASRTIRGGRAPRKRPLAPIHTTSMVGLLHNLERASGVTPIRGRAWHGLRRAFTNLYPVATTDARLLDLLGGWAPGSTMREGTYQKKNDEKVAAAAAELRARMRPGLSGPEGASE